MEESSAIGVGTASVQVDDKEQMPVLSYNSRIYTWSDRKFNIVTGNDHLISWTKPYGWTF